MINDIKIQNLPILIIALKNYSTNNKKKKHNPWSNLAKAMINSIVNHYILGVLVNIY
jgi:hypothetical protein